MSRLDGIKGIRAADDLNGTTTDSMDEGRGLRGRGVARERRAPRPSRECGKPLTGEVYAHPRFTPPPYLL